MTMGPGDGPAPLGGNWAEEEEMKTKQNEDIMPKLVFDIEAGVAAHGWGPSLACMEAPGSVFSPSKKDKRLLVTSAVLPRGC